jgi:hypothetical protein
MLFEAPFDSLIHRQASKQMIDEQGPNNPEESARPASG